EKRRELRRRGCRRATRDGEQQRDELELGEERDSHVSSTRDELRGRPGREGLDDRAEPSAVGRQHVLDPWRPRIQYVSPEDARALELHQPLGQRSRWALSERLAELVEARAAVVRGV